ncbi:ATP synthase F0 subunit B [Helicobacter pylori]|nr:ATP synthase F0 subunit B [Helicobacter pylori]
MQYPNLPNSALDFTNQPEVKEITNELLKQLQSALNSNTLFTDQVELSLKGIVRILEVLLSLDFFKNANEIDSSLRNSIEWLESAGESLKAKMKEYESFFSDFNTSMRANEQEVTNTLNANSENIKSEIKKLENQIIETATKLLTSYQLFLNNAKESANNQINTNKTESLEAIKEAKESANNQIKENQTQALNNITQEKQQATTEITEAKKTAFNELLETLKPKFSGLFAGVYYIRNTIYIQGGWEQKVKDLSDYTLEKSKKYEIEVFFSFVTAKAERDVYFGLKTTEGFLKESLQKITHKYTSQIYYKKLLVENASGVLGLYHGYFYGNINYFNEAVITSIKEIPNDTIISKVSNGSNFTNATSFTQNLNDIIKSNERSNS